MKATIKKANKSNKSLSPVERGRLAAKAMAKELVTDHRRWNLPILSWKNGKIVATQP